MTGVPFRNAMNPSSYIIWSVSVSMPLRLVTSKGTRMYTDCVLPYMPGTGRPIRSSYPELFS